MRTGADGNWLRFCAVVVFHLGQRMLLQPRQGRIFYFSPGDKSYPVYHQPEVRRIQANAVRWTHQREVSSALVGTARESPVGWFK
jgi:trehalose utilization protein